MDFNGTLTGKQDQIASQNALQFGETSPQLETCDFNSKNRSPKGLGQWYEEWSIS